MEQCRPQPYRNTQPLLLVQGIWIVSNGHTLYQILPLAPFIWQQWPPSIQKHYIKPKLVSPKGFLFPANAGSAGPPWILDVLWCQPIKLIHVVSTSEFHEY
jgi:hypothetical protein